MRDVTPPPVYGAAGDHGRVAHHPHYDIFKFLRQLPHVWIVDVARQVALFIQHFAGGIGVNERWRQDAFERGHILAHQRRRAFGDDAAHRFVLSIYRLSHIIEPVVVMENGGHFKW